MVAIIPDICAIANHLCNLIDVNFLSLLKVEGGVNKFEQLILNKKKSLEQKLDQMKVKAIKDMQNISNKIALEAVKKIISNSANDEKMKVINQKNLEKIFIDLTNTKAS